MILPRPGYRLFKHFADAQLAELRERRPSIHDRASERIAARLRRRLRRNDRLACDDDPSGDRVLPQSELEFPAAGELRQEQAKGLRLWAEDQTLPAVGISDFTWRIEHSNPSRTNDRRKYGELLRRVVAPARVVGRCDRRT